MKDYVYIQSTIDIVVTAGLQNEDVTNPDNKQEETVKVSPLPQPKPTVKIKKTIFKRIYDVVPENSWKIESESDIDKYLNALKVSLEKELEDNDIINIDFK